MKKNVMFLVPKLIDGGAEKTVANLSIYLNKYYNIHIVTLLDTKTKYHFDGQYHCVARKKTSNPIIKMSLIFGQIIKIRKLKKKLNICCSISFIPQMDIINVLSNNGGKVVFSIRNKLSSAKYLKGLFRTAYLFCLKRPNQIISITNGVKQDMIDKFGVDERKLHTIYNPAMTVNFGDEVQGKFDVKGENNVITMGRLEEQKGQWHLIRAFGKVVEYDKSAKLFILGEGTLYHYLDSLIEKLNLRDNIVLLGFVQNPYDYIKKANLFVFPSLYEGLGNSLLEVMQLGIPLISADCFYGPREIIAPETRFDIVLKDHAEMNLDCGILVPVCDGNMYSEKEILTKEELILADSIIKVLTNKKLQKKLSINEVKRSKDFSLDSIGNQWRKVIDDSSIFE